MLSLLMPMCLCVSESLFTLECEMCLSVSLVHRTGFLRHDISTQYKLHTHNVPVSFSWFLRQQRDSNGTAKKFVQRKLIFDARTPKPVPPPPTPATAAAALGFSESPSPPLEENTEAQAAAFTAPTSVGLPVGPGDLSAMEEPATQLQLKKTPSYWHKCEIMRIQQQMVSPIPMAWI